MVSGLQVVSVLLAASVLAGPLLGMRLPSEIGPIPTPPGRVAATFSEDAIRDASNSSSPMLGVLRTTVLANNSVLPGSATPPVPGIGDLVADATQGTVYAASYAAGGSSGIATINSTTGNVTGWIPTSFPSVGLAVVPSRDRLLIDSWALGVGGDIAELNTSTNAEVANLTAPGTELTYYGMVVAANGSAVFAVVEAGRIGFELVGWNLSSGAVSSITNLTAVFGSDAFFGVPAVDPRTGYVYVPADNAARIAIVDPGTETVVGSIPLFASDLVIDGTTGTLFAVDEGGTNPRLDAIDLANDSVSTNFSSVVPQRVDVDPANGLLYVLGGSSEADVIVVNATTGAVNASLALPTPPNPDDYEVGYDFDSLSGGRAFYADGQGILVSVELADLAVATVTWVAPVEGSGLAVDPVNGQVYVSAANRGLGDYDPATGAFDSWIDIPDIGYAATDPIFDPADQQMLVWNSTGLVAVNLSDSVIDQYVPIPMDFPAGGEGGFYDPSTHAVYLSLEDDSVVVLNATTLTPLDTFLLGPAESAPIYANGTIYALNYTNGTSIVELDPGNLSIVDRLPVAAIPVPLTGMTYDPASDDMLLTDFANESFYAVNLADGRVSVLTNVLWDGQGEAAVAVDPAVGAVVIIGGTMAVVYGAANLSYLQTLSVSEYANSGSAIVDPATSDVYFADRLEGTLAAIGPELTVASVTASPSSVETGEPTVLAVSVVPALAVAPSYVWTGLPAGCAPADGPQLTCRPGTDGVFAVDVQAQSPYSFGANGTVELRVSERLAVTSFTATPGSIPVNGTSAIAVATVGGLGPLSYLYRGLPSGCRSENASSISCSPSAPGNRSVEVLVQDRAGVTAAAFLNLTVTSMSAFVPPSSGGGGNGGSGVPPGGGAPGANPPPKGPTASSSAVGDDLLYLGGLAIAAVAAAGLLLLSRRRGRSR